MPRRKWSVAQIRELVQNKLKKKPCWYQIQIAQKIRAGKDVVGCARTGSGKTLSFWIPLLMHLDEGNKGFIIVVTPLNLLGKQNAGVLNDAGIKAISVSAENASPKTFKDIENGVYNAVIINPEILISHPEMEKLLKKSSVAEQLQYIVFDEGHCITQWSTFRSDYSKLGTLRHTLPPSVPFYVASATLPSSTIRGIALVLKLDPGKTEYIMRSNDRPEIGIGVRGMAFSARSYRDLDFLIPKDYQATDPPLEPFLIFFNRTKEAEAACKHLRKLLPRSLRNKIRYFHSTMTPEYRDEEVDKMRSGETWGMCCTDAFGMGMDIPGIRIVVQWKAPPDLCVLWQRFGRAARGPGETGVAILIVANGDLYETRARKVVLAERRAEKRKEKAESKRTGNKRKKAPTKTKNPSKRPALGDANATTPQPPQRPNSAQANFQELPHAWEGIDFSDDDEEEVAIAIEAAAEVARNKSSASREIPVDSDFLLERRSLYENTVRRTEVKEAKKNAKRAGVEVGSPMDDFINSVAMGFKCRRTVPALYFRNDKDPRNDHILCDKSTPDGCSRCKPRAMTLCCDLCTPLAFSSYEVTRLPSDKSTAPGKSKLRAMDPEAEDIAIAAMLKTNLLKWRMKSATDKFGSGRSMEKYGSKLFMGGSPRLCRN